VVADGRPLPRGPSLRREGFVVRRLGATGAVVRVRHDHARTLVLSGAR
jgi:hypothetical protein